MGASIDDIRRGADELRAATDRFIDVQAPVRSMDDVPELVKAGATNIYLNAMSLGAAPADAIERLPSLMDEFRAVTS